MSNAVIESTSCILSLKLAKILHISETPIYIKCEYENTTGSHKDRSIWPMIQSYIDEGVRDFVLSSSGNAAISAAWYVRNVFDNPFSSAELASRHSMSGPSWLADPKTKQARQDLLKQSSSENGLSKAGRKERNKRVMLRIFISPRIDPLKRVRLERAAGDCDRISVTESDRPKQTAFQHAQKSGAVHLRASQDDRALVGYETLAQELAEQVPDCGAVFIPTSSGTLAYGLFEGYRKIQNSKFKIPHIHIVQTSKINVIASEYDQDFEPNEASLATAIVDNVAHRKTTVSHSVMESGGAGWVISDDELNHAAEMYRVCHAEFIPESRQQKNSGFRIESGMREKSYTNGSLIEPSFDSLLSLAGFMKALKKGWKFEKPVVLLFTGK